MVRHVTDDLESTSDSDGSEKNELSSAFWKDVSLCMQKKLFKSAQYGLLATQTGKMNTKNMQRAL